MNLLISVGSLRIYVVGDRLMQYFLFLIRLNNMLYRYTKYLIYNITFGYTENVKGYYNFNWFANWLVNKHK